VNQDLTKAQPTQGNTSASLGKFLDSFKNKQSQSSINLTGQGQKKQFGNDQISYIGQINNNNINNFFIADTSELLQNSTSTGLN
jgi:hypothetical protein